MAYNPSRRKNPKPRNSNLPKCFRNYLNIKCLDSLEIKGNWSSVDIWIKCPFAEQCARSKGVSKNTIDFFMEKAKEEQKLSFKIQSKIGKRLSQVLGDRID